MKSILRGVLWINRCKLGTSRIFAIRPDEQIPFWCSLEIAGTYVVCEGCQDMYEIVGVTLRTNFDKTALLDKRDRRFNRIEDYDDIHREFVYRVERYPTNGSPIAQVTLEYKRRDSDMPITQIHEAVLPPFKRGYPHIGVVVREGKTWGAEQPVA